MCVCTHSHTSHPWSYLNTSQEWRRFSEGGEGIEKRTGDRKEGRNENEEEPEWRTIWIFIDSVLASSCSWHGFISSQRMCHQFSEGWRPPSVQPSFHVVGVEGNGWWWWNLSWAIRGPHNDSGDEARQLQQSPLLWLFICTRTPTSWIVAVL